MSDRDVHTSPQGLVEQPNDRPLSIQLYLALAGATRAMNSCHRPLVAPLGLTPTQYLVMLALWAQPSVTVGELGDRVQLSSGTLSPLLSRLELAGLITRRRSADDERAVEVHVTPAGHRIGVQAVDVPDQVARATGMTPNEIADLRDVLQVLTMRLYAADLRRSD